VRGEREVQCSVMLREQIKAFRQLTSHFSVKSGNKKAPISSCEVSISGSLVLQMPSLAAEITGGIIVLAL